MLVAVLVAVLSVTCRGHVTRRSLDLHDALGHQNDFHLPKSVVPSSYRLQLVPHLEDGVFTGSVWINVSCVEPSDSITLHAHESLNTTANLVSLRQLTTSEESRDIAVSSTKKNFAKQWYIIMLAERLSRRADYELHISFSGKLDDQATEAFFRGSYLDSRSQQISWYAATAMETTKARRVFPCFDEPALKATFQVSVAAKRRYHVWSNMPLHDTDNMADNAGWLWHHFPATPAMSTFSVGVFISDYHYVTTVTASGGSIRLSARPELLDSLEGINKISSSALSFAEEYLNLSYPLEKLDVIVLPENSSDYSADSWGLVMLRESDISEPGSAVAGGVLTQWVGHLTTPYWWSGISVYAALIKHLSAQFMAQKLNMTADSYGYPLYKHGSPSIHTSPITGHEYTDRAVWLLRLLNYSLTEDTFRRALHVFLEDRQYKTFTDGDLWDALTSQGHQDQTLEEDVDIAAVATSWLGKELYPAVTVTRNYNNNTATVQQHVFSKERPHNKERKVWYIPIIYSTATNTSAVTWLKDDKQLTLYNLPGEQEFIVVNPEDVGTFLVNYDDTNWSLLTRALLENVLSTQTRAKIIHDSWNLALAGELDVYTALNITLFLKQEKTLQVWERFFAMLDHLRRYLDGTEVHLMFDMYARSLVDDCVRILGPAKQDDDQGRRKLRAAAQMYQHVLSEQQNITAVDENYKSWEESAHPVEYARNVKWLETVLRWGSLEQFQSVLQFSIQLLREGQAVVARIMFTTLARTAPQQTDKVHSLLKVLVLEDTPKSSVNIARVCMDQLSGFYNGSIAALQFVQQHWHDVRNRLESNPELWKVLMSTATARLVTQDDLDMFSEFYVERRGHFGNAELLVEKELERMKEDAVWTSNNIPLMIRWLEEYLDRYVTTSEA